jgi:hypothetical protein
MLESHLAEIKQQEESKLRHPEPITHGKLLHVMLHQENRRASQPQMLAPNLLGRDIHQTNR